MHIIPESKLKLGCGLAAAWLLLLSVPASAQYEPCPGGRQVGVQSGTNNPICEYDTPAPDDGQPTAPQARPLSQRIFESKGAIAWHWGARDVWITVRSGKSIDAVKADTVALCNAQMGRGCTAARWASGGFFAVGHGEDGLLRTGWGRTVKEANADLQTACALDETKCSVVHKLVNNASFPEYAISVTTDYTMVYSPPAAALVGRYGVVALPAETLNAKGSAARAWLATGSNDPEQALQRATQRCADESRKPCKMLLSAVNSNFFSFTDASGKVHWSAALNAKGAKARMQRICKDRLKSKCTLGQMFDTATRRDQVVEY